MSRQAAKEPRVVFGFHAVLSRLRADPKSVVEVFLDETRNDARAKDLAAVAKRSGVSVHLVPAKRLIANAAGHGCQNGGYHPASPADHSFGAAPRQFGAPLPAR